MVMKQIITISIYFTIMFTGTLLTAEGWYFPPDETDNVKVIDYPQLSDLKTEEMLPKALKVLNVHLTPSFLAQKTIEQELQIFRFLNSYIKFGPGVLYFMSINEKKIELVVESITEHSVFKHLIGVVQRGWTSGRTWDTAPGAHLPGGPIVIAAKNIFSSNHGAKSLVLHEVAHGLDELLSPSDTLYSKYSQFDDWAITYNNTEWVIPYAKNNTTEAFAMSYEEFYRSIESRNRLKEEKPNVHYTINKFESDFSSNVTDEFNNFFIQLKKHISDYNQRYSQHGRGTAF